MYKENKIKMSTGERVFNVFNVIFMFVMMFVMFYPMWHVLCASFSDAKQLSSHAGVLLWPDGYSLTAYKLMFKNPMILKGYGHTLYVLFFSMIINMVMTSIAYFFILTIPFDNYL